MSELLKKIKDNYLDSRIDNEKLIKTLEVLNDNQLDVVIKRIKEVEDVLGKCNLRLVNLKSRDLAVFTDHTEDKGVTFFNI